MTGVFQIVEGRYRGAHFLVSYARLDADGALTDGGHDDFGSRTSAIRALSPRRRGQLSEKDGVVLTAFSLRRRVSTLPRSSRMSRSGRARRICGLTAEAAGREGARLCGRVASVWRVSLR